MPYNIMITKTTNCLFICFAHLYYQITICMACNSPSSQLVFRSTCVLHRWRSLNQSLQGQQCKCSCRDDTFFLSLDVDFINENASVANLPTPRIVSVHKSRFAVVMFMECWMEAVYCYFNGKTLYRLHTRDVFY